MVDRSDDAGADPGDRCQVPTRRFNEKLSDICGVMRRRPSEDSLACRRCKDEGPPCIVFARLAHHEPPLGHSAEVMGQTAAFPLHLVRQLE